MDKNGKSEKYQALIEEAMALRTLSAFIAEGVPILQALRTTQMAWNRFGPTLLSMHNYVRDGDSLTSGLEVAHGPTSFQNFVPLLIDIGEEAGEVDTTLMVASDSVFMIARMVERETEDIPERLARLEKSLDYRALALLVKVGIPLFRSVWILAHSTKSKLKPSWHKVMGPLLGPAEDKPIDWEKQIREAKTFETLTEALEDGGDANAIPPFTLAGYMTQSGEKCFSPDDIRLIEEGEKHDDKGDSLSAALSIIADRIQKEALGRDH